jgi:hypothetical protein
LLTKLSIFAQISDTSRRKALAFGALRLEHVFEDRAGIKVGIALHQIDAQHQICIACGGR